MANRAGWSSSGRTVPVEGLSIDPPLIQYKSAECTYCTPVLEMNTPTRELHVFISRRDGGGDKEERVHQS